MMELWRSSGGWGREAGKFGKCVCLSHVSLPCACRTHPEWSMIMSILYPLSLLVWDFWKILFPPWCVSAFEGSVDVELAQPVSSPQGYLLILK